MMSTSRSNVSVGPPYDIGIYASGTHQLDEFRVAPGSPALARLERFWGEHLRDLMDELPAISPADFATE
jgi:putative proteasome-type protease